MKRVFSLVLSFALATGVGISIAGCNKKGNDNSGGVETPDDNKPNGGENNPGGNNNNPGGGDNTNPGGDNTNPGGDNTNPGGDNTNPGGTTTPVKTPKITMSLKKKTIEENEEFVLTVRAQNTTEALVWTISDESVVSIVPNELNAEKFTVKGLAAGTADITASANGASATCAVTVKLAPVVTLSKSTVGLSVKGTEEITATVENTTSTVTWESSDKDVVAVKADGNTATLTGICGGNAVVTAKVGSASASIAVVVESKNVMSYVLYDADGNPAGEKVYTSLFGALNELYEDLYEYHPEKGFEGEEDYKNYVYNATKYDGYTFRAADDTDFIAFHFSTQWLQLLTTEGTEYLGAEGETWGGTNPFVNGKNDRWTSGFDFSKGKCYDSQTRNTFTVTGSPYALNPDGTRTNNPFLVIRPTDWKTADTDGAGGYGSDPSASPIDNGWRSSVFKQGVTGMQYVSEKDNNNLKYKTVRMELDFSASTMAPSKNNKQTAYADIFAGTSALKSADVGFAGGAVYMLGLTFDAGTTATTDELADGTQRGWYISMTTNSWIDYECSYPQSQVVRNRLSDTPAFYSTWDAENKVWKTENTQVTLDISFIFSNDGGDGTDNYKMKCDVAAKVGDAETVNTTATEEFGGLSNRGASDNKFRITYGVFYGPQYTDVRGNSLADLQCGASWKNFVLSSVEATNLDESKQNLNFLAGRNTNKAEFVGIWGLDVLKVTAEEEGSGAVLNFQY